MAKNSIRDYSATNSSNTDIQSIDISEGCSPAGINNAIREVMADLKDVSTGAVALESPAMDSLTVDTTGIVYSGGNVGIGTSSPSYLTEIAGNGGGDTVTLALTNATSGPARVRLNSGHGNWSVGNSISVADALEFRDESAGSTRMFIDNGGNVGIGGSVTSLFNGVGGDMRFVVIGDDSTTTVANNSDAGIAIVNTNQTADNLAGLHFARADTDDSPNYAGASIVAQFPEAQVTGQYPKGELAFLTSTATNSAPSEKMRLTADGSLGIGSSDPQDVLDLGNGTAGTGIAWGGTTGTTHYNTIWSEYGTASIVIGSGLKGSTSNEDFIYPYTGTYGHAAIELDSYSDDGIKFYTAPDGARTAGTTATKNERMRIDSSGSLLVGTTVLPSSARFVSAGTTGTFAGSFVNGVGSQAYGVAISSGTGEAVYFYHGGTIGSPVGSISTNASSTSYNTSSDYRLKENVTADWDATTRLKQLNPVRFNFIADADTTVDGFLAHEVQTVVPEAISGTKDGMMDEEYTVSAATGDIYTPAIEAVLDEDGNEVTPAVAEVIHSTDVERPEELAEGQQWRETTAAVMGTRSVPDYQGIDQSKLVPLLVKTIQELEARITALEAN